MPRRKITKKTLTQFSFISENTYCSLLTNLQRHGPPTAVLQSPTMRPFLARLIRIGLGLIWLWLTLALLWPVIATAVDNTPAPRLAQNNGVNYLILAPEALQASAQAWAAYRQTRGYIPQVKTFTPATNTGENLRRAVEESYLASGRPYPFYVLLLGHANQWEAADASYLPAGTVPIDLPQKYLDIVGFDHIASDDAYAVIENQLQPIAFGRIPARTNAEALSVLARTQAYEATPPTGFARAQVELIASESRFGPEFDTIIEQLVTFFVEEHLPAHYRWHMLYGHPGSPYTYPVENFPQEVAQRLDQNAVLVTYIGHGSGYSLGPALDATGWEGPVFTTADVPLVQNAQGALMTMIACSAGEYDQGRSLAEALLLQPNGPVATYAASRLTLPAANTILGKDLFRVLLTGQAATAGEWIRLAENNYKNPGSDKAISLWLLTRLVPPVYTLAIRDNPDETPSLDAEFVYGLQQHAYNLFGDPALTLALPRPTLQLQPAWGWLPFGTQVEVSGNGALPSGQALPAGQTVTVTLYTRQGMRLSQAPVGDSAKSAALAYAQANDKRVVQLTTQTDDAGRFALTLPLPAGLPSGHYILTALTTQDQATLVGTHALYLGWPPIAEWLRSAWVWWGIVGVALLRGSKLGKRGKQGKEKGSGKG